MTVTVDPLHDVPAVTWRQSLARHAYSLLLAALKPAYLLRLWLRGRAEPLYRHKVLERLGDYREHRDQHDGRWVGDVWVHAVSLGETRAAEALIDALRAERPGLRLLLTHSTATGREAGEALLREGDVQAWLPYDTPGVVQRFFEQFRPRVGVLMETEIWPNLLRRAQGSGIPMVLANARLSEKSRRQGERLAAVLRPAVEAITLVLAQTEADAQRLRESGAREVVVCGNLKFDMAPDEALLARGRAWRHALARPVLLGAVMREGEEAMLLAEWAEWCKSSPAANRPLLLIVPRHPQRFDEVAALVQAAGLTLARRSGWGDTPPAEAWRADAWLGDSMREMALYYAVADVALLGGSFAPLGGQNLIEAAACGCPVVMGPHTFNFAQAAELSQAAGAALRVADMAAGVDTACALLDSPEREQRAAQARAFAAAHRGAAARMVQHLLKWLPR
jgi:3-deoxy-D-manno-octulosonic-acid transferase